MKNLEKSEELYGLEYSSSKDDEVKNHHSSDLTETDESIKLMPERLHLRAFRVLMDYAFYREEPPTKTPARIMQSFVSWRKQVDVNSQRYDRKVESNWGGKDDGEKADNDGT